MTPMAYRLMTLYCAKCRAATPHEYDTENERARCTECADKQLRLKAATRREPTETERHIAALDGYGNRGPK